MEEFDFDQVLYKYRGFGNIEFALDIFLNERLYAANFRSLNDPMEGRFRYSKVVYDKIKIREVIIEKAEYRILSLSESPNNHLLWSYYAEGHSGFVVGVQIIPSNDIKVRKINYVEDFHLEEVNAENILTMKHETWQHENEFRVLKNNYGELDNFVNVKIKEVIFGKNTASGKSELLKNLIHKVLPTVEIRTMSDHEIREWLSEN